MRLHRRLVYMLLVACLAVPAAAVACVKSFEAGAQPRQSEPYVESESRVSSRSVAPWDAERPCAAGETAGTSSPTAGGAYVQASQTSGCGGSRPAATPACPLSATVASAPAGTPEPDASDEGDEETGSSDESESENPDAEESDTDRSESDAETSDTDRSESDDADADADADEANSDDASNSGDGADDGDESPDGGAETSSGAERPSTSPCAGGADGSSGAPAAGVDLSNWKLQLPEGEEEKPTEIEAAELEGYQSPWFQKEPSGAIRFRAPVNGVTTKGSKNPRSELREMSGGDKASWSTSSGTSTMIIDEAITRLPEGKPQVVAGQIHGTSDDLSVFRLEGSKLYVTNGDDSNFHLVDPDYKLGTRFEAKFVTGGGKISAFYNGKLETTIEQSSNTAYFKAGAYTQANCETAAPCSSDNLGEVVIYGLTVTHAP
jgi:Alginate lyase